MLCYNKTVESYLLASTGAAAEEGRESYSLLEQPPPRAKGSVHQGVSNKRAIRRPRWTSTAEASQRTAAISIMAASIQ
jgi:hypothetical protein